MFGQLRENILTSLALIKDNQVELKNKFAKYTKVLKESTDLNSYYSLYEQVETAYFADSATAKEFLDECLSALKKVDIKSVNKLKVLSEGKDVVVLARTKLLDQLVFNQKLTIKERYDNKVKLIKSLTEKVDKVNAGQEVFSNLDKKVNSDITQMTAHQKEALNIFLENDLSKIKDYYKSLVEGLIDSIDSLTLESTDTDEVKKIIETKRKLIKMKNESASISSVDTLLELKESFIKKI